MYGDKIGVEDDEGKYIAILPTKIGGHAAKNSAVNHLSDNRKF